MTRTPRHKEWLRQKVKANHGFCVHCDEVRAPDSKLYCPAHRDRHRTHARNSYRKLKGVTAWRQTLR